jgi:hypothetical protein
MRRELKYLKLFENAVSQSLKSRFLKTFTDGLTDIYWRMPEVAFAVWKHLSHDKGNVGKLIDLGLFDESNLTQAKVRRLPGIERIVCIYGGGIEETKEKADLLNQMCDSIVTGFPGGRGPNHYEIHLDEDHLVDQKVLETVDLTPGGRHTLIGCKTFSNVPLLIVERMSWTIWLNVDDLDKIEP